MLQKLCAALGAAFCFVAPQQLLAEEASPAHVEAFDLLRAGGNVLVIRHASSPHDQIAPVGLSAGCTLGDGRGLNGKGLFQARAVGDLLAREEVPVLKAYTSKMCRSWDTGMLAAGGQPVEAHPSQITTDPKDIAQFKKQIEAELAANPGQNIMLTNHSNIAPLYGATAEVGEDEVPEGAVFVVRPPEWTSIMRIEINVDVGPQTVTVE